ncbi:hypothetical protein PVAND_006793 [Polypedilum vanderplanki]|uniref:Uncharacterized protein n=1 Tax=Polypedilum vanderplanki TaxID=319348 RepID=A0A9J6C598_POLVA|nr:hypothetical protein PVAND_006793 [Polypedilum vanderplanki]
MIYGVRCKFRTGNQGVFPSAYAVDLEYNDFDPTNVEMKREDIYLVILGSVETLSHKGTGVKKRERGPCIDYFYSLKNVSFCAFHPRDHRYIGFIQNIQQCNVLLVMFL